MADYYVADGLRHTRRADDELTTEIVVPLPSTPRRAGYAKWTVRRSIDFPLVSVALRFDLARDSVHAAVEDLAVVVGVLGAKPRVVTRLDDAIGKKLSDPALAGLVADRAHAQCKPLENVPYEAPYRRRMIQVYTRRAIEAIVAAG
jgi:CO/xanthine dehydrogenase FAD-binding subunit